MPSFGQAMLVCIMLAKSKTMAHKVSNVDLDSGVTAQREASVYWDC